MYAHGCQGMRGCWFPIWGQMWPLMLFGGYHGLRDQQQNDIRRENVHVFVCFWGHISKLLCRVKIDLRGCFHCPIARILLVRKCQDGLIEVRATPPYPKICRSHYFQKTVRYLSENCQLQKSVRELSENCHICVRKLSNPKLCQKYVR